MKALGTLFLILATLAPVSAQTPAPAPSAQPAPHAETLPRVAPEKLGILPVEADRRFAALKANVPSSAWSWIEQKARVEAERPAPDPAALKAEIAKRFGSGLPPAEVDAVTFLVLTQATKDLDSDMRAVLAHAQMVTEPQEPPKAGNGAPPPAEDTAPIRLRTLMDRRTKLIESLSSILKKMSDMDSSIVANLK
jgi:hypothetical protein